MLASPLKKSLIAAAVSAYMLAGASFANSTTALPPLQHSGAHSYVTGGIGLDESSAFRRAMNDWPLSLRFAEKDGMKARYVADVQVHVTDENGKTAISAKSEGPFMLIKVPAGTYKIDATLGGQSLHQRAEVKNGQPAKITFLWPARTDETH